MATIQQCLTQINTAVYGKDVRSAIHDGIEQCYSDVTKAKTLAQATIDNQQTVITNSNTAIEQKANSAKSDIDSKVATAKSDIDAKVTSAKTDLTNTANSAKTSVTTAATNATNDISTKLANATAAISAATTNANNAADNANTQAAAAKTAAENANNIVLVQESQPAENSGNKIWVKPTSDEYQVPTWQEFSEVRDLILGMAARIEELEAKIA